MGLLGLRKLVPAPDENIRLDAAEDMTAVRILIHVLQDEPDKARALIRSQSRRDNALTSFSFGEVSRLLESEDFLRLQAEERDMARDKTTSEIVDGHLRDV